MSVNQNNQTNTNSNMSNDINVNSSSNIDDSSKKSIEAKLGDLMMNGWTMLADSCFNESCSTPLMRDNITKQVYCVGCEAWVINKERERIKEKVKFNEVVSLEGRRNIALKESKKNNEVSKLEINSSKDFPNFREILENKLISMSHWLKNETDPDKCNSILDAMKKIMEMLKSFQINN